MRWTFKDSLYDRMSRDERVHLLWCDVGLGLFKQHRADFPSRVYQLRDSRASHHLVCRWNELVRDCGPIVYSILPFIIERAFEQIKIDVDQMNLPVGIIGHSDGNSGPTHEELNAPVLMGLCKNIRSHFHRDDCRDEDNHADGGLGEAVDDESEVDYDQMTKKQGKKRQEQDISHFHAMIPLINKHIPRRFMDKEGKDVVLPRHARYETAPFEGKDQFQREKFSSYSHVAVNQPLELREIESGRDLTLDTSSCE